jgi:hypothetical protein
MPPKPQPRTSAKTTVKSVKKDVIIPYELVQWRPNISNIKFKKGSQGTSQVSFLMNVEIEGSPGGYHYQKKHASFINVVIPQLMTWYHEHLSTQIKQMYERRGKNPHWAFAPYAGMKRCKNGIEFTFLTSEDGPFEKLTPSGKGDDMQFFLERVVDIRYSDINSTIYFPIAKSYAMPTQDEETDKEYAATLKRFEEQIKRDLSRIKEYYGWASYFTKK